MPLTHERTFRVRYYECDPYGHLNNSNYLRYMQETAFDASTAAGYDFARYQAMARTWWIRSSEIEYLAPVRYNQRVTIKTWVEDFLRTHSHRAYEFTNSDTGEQIARATTDWAFLDTNNGRPTAIPQEMQTAFFPEGVPPDPPKRPRIPPPPPPPDGVFTSTRRVGWRDLDTNGHVNNANYLAFAEDCGVQVADAFGWPMSRCAEAGFGIIVRRHQIIYHKPAVLDDRLAVSTWVSDVKRTRAIRHYTLQREADGERLARLRSLYVWVDLATMRPIRIPSEFLTEFGPNIVT